MRGEDYLRAAKRVEDYLRRVKDPNPFLEVLARQVCDQLERWIAEGLVVQPSTIAQAAGEAGVPLDYVRDEQERRVRERMRSP
jgi:hypothetical protein